ncbi:hypothetical protein AGABI2DRAFT_180183 [Agaricus bisporus var. bisporus H97]|uniref:hypothetical protein n=1 Tax=Agaricus bisporus var. bisporus (strain H97 / ATCC MYA-4626 / FGSC 10389) TaxID=936046 RepID=UPI00029F7722|nr:hypothetical protein AGABI2DRAFT_180183 [Agaricus bisporus var. bisporus H97]EKV44757.1 hypothetical protein AGABI2DRAFT_180183 [Agaricus bisporus var. bisporus H97]
MSLFHNTKYFLANSLPPNRQEQLEYALSKNGAIKADTLTNATHVITNSAHFEGSEYIDQGVFVVSDQWVDRSLVLGKLQGPQYYSADPGMIFSGIIACATEQLPSHDLEVLSAGITALGGQWRVALTSDVTHLFATSPNSPKYTTALAHRDSAGIKILLPHWFDDSVRLGIKNLSVEPYLWPNPPLLTDIGATANIKTHNRQSSEDKAKKALLSTMNDFTPSFDSKVPLPKDVDLMLVKKNVWNGKRILLSWTLSLYGSRREAVEAGIRRAGGMVLRYPTDDDEDLTTEAREKRRDKKEARAVDECDILITRWRSGRSYGRAFRLHKTIGTMAWLYHVESSGQTPRPVDQLLHYPVPRTPINNFGMHEITVTNYTGEAREYIKKLISSMGAKFTPSMTGKNTVLIAAYIQGTKADKARAWSIPIVNHTWLEDCYIQWRHLTMATEKYIVFPPGVDFSKLLGERGVGIRGVELCDEEEGKEGDSGSEDENAMDVDHVQDDGVWKEDEHDDLDILSMPDPDDLRELSIPPQQAFKTPSKKSPMKSKAHGKSSSVSPSKRVISASVSPTKRSPTKREVEVVITPARKGAYLDAMRITPAKSASRSSSPVKRRTIVPSNERGRVGKKDATSDVDGDDEGTSRSRAQTPELAPMEVDEEGIDRDVVDVANPPKKKPVMKPNSKANGSVGSKKTKKRIELIPEPEVSGESDATLNRTPATLRRLAKKTPDAAEDDIQDSNKKSSPRKRPNEDDESYHQTTEATTATSSVISSASSPAASSDVSSDVSQPPPKRRLIRRLTSEASSELEKEKEREKEKMKNRSLTKLTRRATNGRIPSEESVDHELADNEIETGDEGEEEKENVVDVHVKSPRKSKSDAPPLPKTSLLKMTRGDARTRVKVKSAKAKARELYSSEEEVMDIVKDKPMKGKKGKEKAKAKAKAKAKEEIKPKKKGRQSKVVSEDEESTHVESEDEEEVGQGGDPATKKTTLKSLKTRPSRQNLVEVVINTPMKTPEKTQAKTYSSKSKGKKKAVAEDEENADSSEVEKDAEETEEEKPVSRRDSLRKLKKTESIRAEAEEKAVKASTLRPKPISKAGSTLGSKPKSKRRQLHHVSPPPDSSRTHTPVTDTNEPLPAKRGAATRAQEKLKVMMPDATKFEAELRKARKSGGGMAGIGIGSWEQEEDSGSAIKSRNKRKSNDMDVDEEMEDGGKKRRRSSGKARVAEENEDEVVAVPPGKKAKAKAKPSDGHDQAIASDKIYLMTTQVALPDNISKILEKLGVSMTTRPTQCTHLLAPQLVRTEKFLCALATAPYILEASWATKSASAKQLLPEANFLLRDEKAEVKYGMKLEEALERARQLRGTLFIDKIFYVTPKTKVDFKLLKSVVTTHGGQLMPQSPTVRSLKGHTDRYVISCPEDISIWRPLVAQNIPIFTQEFLLIGVLKQELDWDNRDLRVPGLCG